MESDIKVSIIVPVYNVEKYVSQCIESIINQSFHEIEIILVDDCSTDNSLSICKEYAKKDSRIVLKQNKKLGVSEARNTGIREAKGEYIIFVDSDDWIEPDMVEKMYYKAIKSESEIIMCSTYVNISKVQYVNDFYFKDYIFKGKEKIIIEKQLTYVKGVYKPQKGEYKLQRNICSPSAPWAKIYKTSFIKDNNLWLDKSLVLAEDMIFNLYAFEYATQIEYFKIPLYHYRKRTSSACNVYDEKKLEKFQNMLVAFKKFIDTTTNYKDEMMNAYNLRVFYIINSYLRELFRSNLNGKEIKEKMGDVFEKYKKNIKLIKSSNLTLKSKLTRHLIIHNRLNLLMFEKLIINIKFLIKKLLFYK